MNNLYKVYHIYLQSIFQANNTKCEARKFFGMIIIPFKFSFAKGGARGITNPFYS
jgi:hypothetical protein